jgi:hypothetical protein
MLSAAVASSYSSSLSEAAISTTAVAISVATETAPLPMPVAVLPTSAVVPVSGGGNRSPGGRKALQNPSNSSHQKPVKPPLPSAPAQSAPLGSALKSQLIPKKAKVTDGSVSKPAAVGYGPPASQAPVHSLHNASEEMEEGEIRSDEEADEDQSSSEEEEAEMSDADDSRAIDDHREAVDDGDASSDSEGDESPSSSRDDSSESGESKSEDDEAASGAAERRGTDEDDEEDDGDVEGEGNALEAEVRGKGLVRETREAGEEENITSGSGEGGRNVVSEDMDIVVSGAVTEGGASSGGNKEDRGSLGESSNGNAIGGSQSSNNDQTSLKQGQEGGVVKRKRGRPAGSTSASLVGGDAETAGGEGGPGPAAGGRGRGRGGRGGGGRGPRKKRMLEEVTATTASGNEIAGSGGKYSVEVVSSSASSVIGGLGNFTSNHGAASDPNNTGPKFLTISGKQVKLCKSHRLRLKNRQQRDAIHTMLSGKLDNVNIFVAIHEIVRLELDSQGIDLMRLDPSQDIDPRIIQLLRNISHPASIMNLSILNCSDVAASLNLLETKGHKLFAELAAIALEIERLEKERKHQRVVIDKIISSRGALNGAVAPPPTNLAFLEHIVSDPVLLSANRDVIAANIPSAPPKKCIEVLAAVNSRSSSKLNDDVRDSEQDASSLPPKHRWMNSPLVLTAEHPVMKRMVAKIRSDNKKSIDDATFVTSGRLNETVFNGCAADDHSASSASRFLDTEEFKSQVRRIVKNRRNVTTEIRRRKLVTRAAWEYLGDQYDEAHHRWKHHVDCQVKMQKARELQEGPIVIPAAPEPDDVPSPGAPSRGHSISFSSSSRSRGASGEAHGGSINASSAASGSSSRAPGSRLYAMRSTANSAASSLDIMNASMSTGDASLYDHDAIMHKIALAELMQRRIETGGAWVPDMLTPWQGPKPSQPPQPLVWPHAIAKLYNNLNNEVSKAESAPADAVKAATVDDHDDKTAVKIELSENSDLAQIDAKPETFVSITLNVEETMEATDTGSRVNEDKDLMEVVKHEETKAGNAPTSAIVYNDKMDELMIIPKPFPGPIPASPEYIDLCGNRLTTNGLRQLCGYCPADEPCPPMCNCALKVDIEERRFRPWSDMEKCIFVDKFIQYPKNYAKIASFLTNRTTKDCVKFYYDSKYSFWFKSLLREMQGRKRNMKSSWKQASISAASAGGAVYAPDDADDRRPIFELPYDDMAFITGRWHTPYNSKVFPSTNPIFATVMDNGSGSIKSGATVSYSSAKADSVVDNGSEDIGSSTVILSKASCFYAASMDAKYMRPSTASTYLRRLMDNADSDDELGEEESFENMQLGKGYLGAVVKKRKMDLMNTSTGPIPPMLKTFLEAEKAFGSGLLTKQNSVALNEYTRVYKMPHPWQFTSGININVDTSTPAYTQQQPSAVTTGLTPRQPVIQPAAYASNSGPYTSVHQQGIMSQGNFGKPLHMANVSSHRDVSRSGLHTPPAYFSGDSSSIGVPGVMGFNDSVLIKGGISLPSRLGVSPLPAARPPEVADSLGGRSGLGSGRGGRGRGRRGGGAAGGPPPVPVPIGPNGLPISGRGSRGGRLGRSQVRRIESDATGGISSSVGGVLTAGPISISSAVEGAATIHGTDVSTPISTVSESLGSDIVTLTTDSNGGSQDTPTGSEGDSSNLSAFITVPSSGRGRGRGGGGRSAGSATGRGGRPKGSGRGAAKALAGLAMEQLLAMVKANLAEKGDLSVAIAQVASQMASGFVNVAGLAALATSNSPTAATSQPPAAIPAAFPPPMHTSAMALSAPSSSSASPSSSSSLLPVAVVRPISPISATITSGSSARFEIPVSVTKSPAQAVEVRYQDDVAYVTQSSVDRLGSEYIEYEDREDEVIETGSAAIVTTSVESDLGSAIFAGIDFIQASNSEPLLKSTNTTANVYTSAFGSSVPDGVEADAGESKGVDDEAMEVDSEPSPVPRMRLDDSGQSEDISDQGVESSSTSLRKRTRSEDALLEVYSSAGTEAVAYSARVGDATQVGEEPGAGSSMEPEVKRPRGPGEDASL